jgi:hypothetical protein
VYAAIALADYGGYDATDLLSRVVRTWWRGQVAPVQKSGKRVLTTIEVYPLFELLHAIRDTINIDLREDVPKYFKDLPTVQLLSYYPATYPAAENDYHIPAFSGKGEPDLRVAAMSRMAELSMVAYDSNAQENQFLQGWLSHDRLAMKGTLGAPYEFLWMNPYQPGLSFYHMPLRYHDERTGRLFLRSSWDEDATWLGYFDRQVQLFESGKIQLVSLQARNAPLIIGDQLLVAGKPKMQLTLEADGPSTLFVLGLKPRATYWIEVDDEELAEEHTDSGGILGIVSTRKDERGVKIQEQAKGS